MGIDGNFKGSSSCCQDGKACKVIAIFLEAYSLINERRRKMSTTGEKPGKGTYVCKNCGQPVALDDDTDTLPPCSNCTGTEYAP